MQTPSADNAPLPALLRFLQSQDLRSDSHLLVALSGGADSVALLLAASQAANKLGFGLSAFHVNCGVDASDDDAEALCRKLCDGLDLQLHVLQSTLDAESPQHLWRIERYRFAESLHEKHDFCALLTAHHREDQLETLIMSLFRTGSLEGINPIPRQGRLSTTSRLALWRPWLDICPEDIRAWLNNLNQPWVEDSGNQKSRYQRNRVRNELLPLLESIFGESTKDRLLSLCDDLELEASWFEKHRSSILDESTLTLKTSLRGVALTPTLLRRAAAELLFTAGIPRRDATRALVESLLSCDASPKRLRPGLIATREADRITLNWSENEAFPALEAQELSAFPTELETPLGKLSFSLTEELTTGEGFELIDHAKSSGPLRVCPWQAGDRIQPLGMEGTRKLQDVFTDARVPREHRPVWPVLCDTLGIVALPGIMISQRVALDSASTQAVKITFHPREDQA